MVEVSIVLFSYQDVQGTVVLASDTSPQECGFKDSIIDPKPLAEVYIESRHWPAMVLLVHHAGSSVSLECSTFVSSFRQS